MKRWAVRYDPLAIRELQRLEAWIGNRSFPDRAAQYIGRIKSYCDGFSTSAERGTRRDDLFPGLRCVGFERTLTIVFVVTDDTVTFLHFAYRGRDWTSLYHLKAEDDS